MTLLLVVKVIACLAFIVAGVMKLMKVKPLVDQFHDFRIPLEIMYFIGVLEVLGAIALWFDILTLWAFSGLACLMLGAMKSHFGAKHPVTSYVPALALFCLCVVGVLLVR